eukprot:5502922-Pleurochrysis_carterae.AAC.1
MSAARPPAHPPSLRQEGATVWPWQARRAVSQRRARGAPKPTRRPSSRRPRCHAQLTRGSGGAASRARIGGSCSLSVTP